MTHVRQKGLKLEAKDVNALRDDAIVQCELLMSVFAAQAQKDTKFKRLETSAKFIEALREKGAEFKEAGQRASFNYISSFFVRDAADTPKAAAAAASR